MNEAKLHSFVGQVVADMAVSMSGVMTNIGHKLGLYQVMAGAGPMTPMELAMKTGVRQRYIKKGSLKSCRKQVLGNSVVLRRVRST